MLFAADDETQMSGELVSLAENFREQAAVLVDMLDVSIPMVAKLKVKTAHCSFHHYQCTYYGHSCRRVDVDVKYL